MSLLPVLAVLLSAQVAISDLYARRVSNRWLLCVGMVALGGLLWMWAVRGAPFPGMHLAGAVVGLAALLPFYALGWMGAGDVKYFAVLGLLLGMPARPGDVDLEVRAVEPFREKSAGKAFYGRPAPDGSRPDSALRARGR